MENRCTVVAVVAVVFMCTMCPCIVLNMPQIHTGVKLRTPGYGEKELVFPEVRPRKFEDYSPVPSMPLRYRTWSSCTCQEGACAAFASAPHMQRGVGHNDIDMGYVAQHILLQHKMSVQPGGVGEVRNRSCCA